MRPGPCAHCHRVAVRIYDDLCTGCHGEATAYGAACRGCGRGFAEIGMGRRTVLQFGGFCIPCQARADEAERAAIATARDRRAA